MPLRTFAAASALLIASLIVSLSGCAGLASEHGLQRASARVIAPTPYPDSVKITEIHSSITGDKRWVATLPGGVYDCTQEGGERQPICVKRPANP
jgi:hypothetical protein